MAALKNQNYPVELNPFGTDEEEEESGGNVGSGRKAKTHQDDYPEYLSPFGEDDGQTGPSATVDDYDDSLNPFGDEETNEQPPETVSDVKFEGESNPFDEDHTDDVQQDEHINGVEEKRPDVEANSLISCPSQQDSLEPPPIPLPRTKSLLKKEQAQKSRQQNHQQPLATDSTQTISLLSTTSSNSSSSITTLNNTNAATTGSFQRKKNKRNAPPVPINFKRQVSGSLDAIEEELNEIGDKLAIIDKESNLCQEDLKATNQVDVEAFTIIRSKFIELIKRKNSIVRRQKELMYRKRELKLDQIHSDIEYELRMIGNKQLSHRTAEDEAREKELLKKLVEIVEEKSDIVENLNKDTSCDNEDIEEAFRRLNIASDPTKNDEPENKNTNNSSDVSPKNGSCDKSILAKGTKLSKIATLLPKGSTIKGTMKIRRKRLFKKCDSRPVER